MTLNTKNLKAVIFDWDNTLAESRTTLVASVNEVLKKYGLADWESVKHLRNPDLSFRDNFCHIFKDNAQNAYAEYAKIYCQKVKASISSFPCVAEVLSFFKEKNIPIIIMSNKDIKLLELELPILFDRNIFARVVGGHQAQRDKPYPEHIFYSIDGYLKPEEITRDNLWVVGDSPQDSNCALAAGALPIRIGESIWHDEEEHNPNVVFFNDFCSFIEGIE